MKTFVNILLILAMVWVITYTEGWWTLMGFLPFFLLLSSIGSHYNIKSAKSKSITPSQSLTDENGKYVYQIIDSSGEKFLVKCDCTSQLRLDGPWIVFTDESSNDSDYYVSREAFYKPRHVQLIEPVSSEELKKMN